MTDHKKNTIKLRLLRHGIAKTGGAFYETFLAEKLCALLKLQGFLCYFTDIISKRKYIGRQNFKLLWWGFKNASADINIVVARLAVPALVRSFFSGSLTIIVFHNYDERDGKSKFLVKYYKLLFYLLKKCTSRNVAIVTVSPFFKDFFASKFPNLPVFCIPNLFDISIYAPYKKCLKQPKAIFLGQYSTKNDDSVFTLAENLTHAGYYCFFCTVYPENVKRTSTYEVIYVPFEKYLEKMAEAYCTIAFTGINEGWNRLTHESILVGTPVIGYKRGGLGNLLVESNSYIVYSADEAFDLITGETPLKVNAPHSFYSKFSVELAAEYISPLTDFCKHYALSR